MWAVRAFARSPGMSALPCISRIRRIALAAAFAATAIAPAAASATETAFTPLDSSFATGDANWTSTATCGPLCTVVNTVDGGPGASTPGSLTVVYTTLAGLLGGLASGTSTWTSPSFTWVGATPDSAVVTFARKAAISGLLAAGGSSTVRVQLRDQTVATSVTLASDALSAADSSFSSHSVPVDPALLRPDHSYRVLVTTTLAAPALLSNIRVSFDDIALTGMVATAAAGGTGGAAGAGGSGAPGASGGGVAPGASDSGTAASAGAALRLSAAATVRFAPGRRVALRVRATRAGAPVANVAITLRMGTRVRRLTTGRDGIASLELLRRVRSALRVTFRAGGATATTWARPG
jgi:hypothetical protein